MGSPILPVSIIRTLFWGNFSASRAEIKRSSAIFKYPNLITARTILEASWPVKTTFRPTFWAASKICCILKILETTEATIIRPC